MDVSQVKMGFLKNVYLATPGFSCGTGDLQSCCGVQDLFYLVAA